MKRLIKKITRKALSSFIDKRNNRRTISAEWVPTEVSDPNSVQYVTDVMAAGGPIQIQYEDGGIRTIYPYGWNTSKDGNILIMCYKDDGGVRSYRLDRIQKFFFDSSVIEQNEVETAEQPEETSEEINNPSLEVSDYGEENNDQLPSLPPEPQVDNTVPTELPYDDALNVLDQSEMPGGVQELEQPQSQQPQLEVEDYDDDVQNAENNEEEEQKAAKTIKRLIRKTGV